MPGMKTNVNNIVKKYKGTIPVLLISGHGGTKQVPGVPPRNGSNIPAKCKKHFRTDSDLHTLTITNGLAQEIRDLTNEDPYRVHFTGDRLYLDVNREKRCGCEVAQAEIYYDAYHSAIAQFAQEIRTKNICGNGIVFAFDIHGKDDDMTDVSVGTRNEETIEPVVNFNPGWGWDYKYGLLALLKERGYAISPGSPCEGDDPKFFGGFTVNTHGGWQFEINESIRESKSKRKRFVKDLAEGISIFYKHNCI